MVHTTEGTLCKSSSALRALGGAMVGYEPAAGECCAPFACWPEACACTQKGHLCWRRKVVKGHCLRYPGGILAASTTCTARNCHFTLEEHHLCIQGSLEDSHGSHGSSDSTGGKLIRSPVACGKHGCTDLGHFCCSKGGQSRCICLVKSCDSRAAHSADPQRHKGSVAPLLHARLCAASACWRMWRTSQATHAGKAVLQCQGLLTGHCFCSLHRALLCVSIQV